LINNVESLLASFVINVIHLGPRLIAALHKTNSTTKLLKNPTGK